MRMKEGGEGREHNESVRKSLGLKGERARVKKKE